MKPSRKGLIGMNLHALNANHLPPHETPPISPFASCPLLLLSPLGSGLDQTRGNQEGEGD
jgi:hypothetical protein